MRLSLLDQIAMRCNLDPARFSAAIELYESLLRCKDCKRDCPSRSSDRCQLFLTK